MYLLSLKHGCFPTESACIDHTTQVLAFACFMFMTPPKPILRHRGLTPASNQHRTSIETRTVSAVFLDKSMHEMVLFLKLLVLHHPCMQPFYRPEAGNQRLRSGAFGGGKTDGTA